MSLSPSVSVSSPSCSVSFVPFSYSVEQDQTSSIQHHVLVDKLLSSLASDKKVSDEKRRIKELKEFSYVLHVLFSSSIPLYFNSDDKEQYKMIQELIQYFLGIGEIVLILYPNGLILTDRTWYRHTFTIASDSQPLSTVDVPSHLFPLYTFDQPLTIETAIMLTYKGISEILLSIQPLFTNDWDGSFSYPFSRNLDTFFRLIPGSYKNGTWKQLNGIDGLYMNDVKRECRMYPPSLELLTSPKAARSQSFPSTKKS